MKIVIINPTYNEKDNIEILVKSINIQREIIEKSKDNELIQLIVDDNSPDGTADIVKKLQGKYKFLKIIHGKKQGLGKAYIRGMQYSIKTLKADIVIEMDADLQHPVKLLSPMIKKLDKGFDLVIASRYIKGGSYPKEWSKFRILNSKIANILARYIAGIYNVKDCTSGYRVIRVKNILDKVNFHHILADGYSFQLMLLANLVNKKAKIYEYPFDFKERNAGESKVGMNASYLRDIFEFFRNAILIRIYNSRQIINFLIVGGVGAIINLAIYRFSYNYLHSLFYSELLAGEISIIFNFILNHLWTFKNSKTSWLNALVKYNLSSIVSIGISSFTVLILGNLFGHEPRLWYAAIGIILGTIWNYSISSKIIWK